MSVIAALLLMSVILFMFGVLCLVTEDLTGFAKIRRRVRSWWSYPGFVIYDRDHRVLVQFSSYRFQFWSFFAERDSELVRTTRATDSTLDGFTDTRYYFWRIGRHPKWLEVQSKKKQCTKCKRWVGHPCQQFIGYEIEDTYHSDGPWDGSCSEIYHPERYR